MTTIKQVADRAGVSVATVSRVINKTGYVSVDLQERVADAMRTLHYQPSALARGLRRQQTQTVGVLVPHLNHPFFSMLAHSVERTLFAVDYRTFICSTEETQEREDAYVSMLLRQRVDGVILVPNERSRANVYRLQEQGIPVVLVDRAIPGLEVNAILVDNEAGAAEAARCLVDLGHRRIGVIGGPAHQDVMIARFRGLRRIFDEAGVAYEEEMMVGGGMDHVQMGLDGAGQLLAGSPRPTAIFALTDVMAVGVMHAAAGRGLAIPRDLSIVGFDGLPLAEYTLPPLTTVAQPVYRMGEHAARRLLSQIVEPDQPPQRIVLEAALRARATTAPPGGG